MKRHLRSVTAVAFVLAALAGLAPAQETLSPEEFRASYLGLVDDLASLPLMTHTFVPDPQSDDAARTRVAALAQMQANLWDDLAANQDAISRYSDADLLNLQAQLQATGVEWRALPALLRKVVTPEQLAFLDPAQPQSFPDDNCISNAGFTAAGVAKAAALIIRVVASQSCKAAQCAGAASTPPCIFAGIAREAFVITDAVLQGSVRCHAAAFQNEAERRLGVNVTTRATQDSVGIRNDCDTSTGHCARNAGTACTTNAQCGDAFSALNLHDKLQTRLDVDLSTRSTQDSVDGQREAPVAPSNEKSVRTVVDKIDEIVLPRLQRKMNALNAAIAAQGSLLRDLQLLQTRFQVSENLFQRHPRFLPMILFQMPHALRVPAKKFCSVTTNKSCSSDADCPPAITGETCEPATPPRSCSQSGQACTDTFDCPIQPQPAEVCLPQANPTAGLLQVAGDIVQETINMNRADGADTGSSQIDHTRAMADIDAGNYKQAYRHLRKAYRRAVRP